MSWKIKIPATTANIGPGFDSIGIALDLHLLIKVSSSRDWSFVSHSKHLKDVPTGKENYMYKIAIKVAKKYGHDTLRPCHIELFSEIPLARGLGSSATAIVGGIELANLLLELNLSVEDKIKLATEIEGHPDNVVPAILGGCVIGHFDQDVNYVHTPIHNLAFVTVIPKFELKTEDARKVLPESFDYKDAVRASSVANVLTAALLQSDWKLVGEMLQKDQFHQPFRKSLIPHYEALEALVKADSYGVYLSGAGPTMIALVDPAVAEEKIQSWREAMSEHEWLILKPTNEGISIIDGY